MEEYELRSLLDDLDAVDGRGTWHISLYCRPDRALSQVSNEIRSEYAEAENIKSDDTRKKVQDSLGKIKSALGQMPEMPENGLVLFSSPATVHVLDDLPFEVQENLYHCGKGFQTETLKERLQRGGDYGLLVLEKGEATLGKLAGERVITLTNTESNVMGKTQAGGQSQQRFERERERQKHEFFQEVAEKAKNAFVGEDISGFVVGGTNHTVSDFTSNDYLHYELEEDLIGPYNVEYANEQGLNQLVGKASDAIDEEETKEARQVVADFFDALRSDDAEYGTIPVKQAIEYGAVDTLILTTEVNRGEIETFEKLARNYGTDVVVVETSFEKAEMFQNMTGGVGALLRFQV